MGHQSHSPWRGGRSSVAWADVAVARLGLESVQLPRRSPITTVERCLAGAEVRPSRATTGPVLPLDEPAAACDLHRQDAGRRLVFHLRTPLPVNSRRNQDDDCPLPRRSSQCPNRPRRPGVAFDPTFRALRGSSEWSRPRSVHSPNRRRPRSGPLNLWTSRLPPRLRSSLVASRRTKASSI